MGFQSIGVTKEWRLLGEPGGVGAQNHGFQSIGVTKEWRRVLVDTGRDYHEPLFPINRRHQRMATGVDMAI